jgi:hypothetical protein
MLEMTTGSISELLTVAFEEIGIASIWKTYLTALMSLVDQLLVILLGLDLL